MKQLLHGMTATIVSIAVCYFITVPVVDYTAVFDESTSKKDQVMNRVDEFLKLTGEQQKILYLSYPESQVNLTYDYLVAHSTQDKKLITPKKKFND